MAGKVLGRRDAGRAWLERWNPLAGLSVEEAQAVFDAARGGDTQRLHWIFQEVERANPTLTTCVERRTAALAGLPWSATVRASADPVLAAEQRDAVERLVGGIGNFDEAVEHLDLAFFRGFAYAQPVWEADGAVRRISLLDSWAFLERDGRLYYNPACDGLSPGAEEVTPEAGLVGVRRTRAIDYPALAVHIREAVGERDWGRFLERIALPKPAVTMAPNATDDDRAGYLEAAESVEDGRVSVWPNGAALTDFMGGSRGQDPFSAFIRHQEERIVRMATGGTLGSIAEAGSGTLAGGAQADVWREIVARDAVIVGAALMRSLVRPYLERAFPGRPCAVDFGFDAEKRLGAKECAEVAATLRAAGWRVDRAELEEATGFTLEEDAGTPPQGAFGAFARSAGRPSRAACMQRALQPCAKRAAASGRTTRRKTDGALPGAFLRAFAEDTSEAAKRVRELLADPTPEAARRLLDDLPKLMPEDPALAALLAEEMAGAFAGAHRPGRAATARECQAKDPARCPTHGVPEARPDTPEGVRPASDDEVAGFRRDLPGRISPETAESLLTKGFTDTDADGNTVRYGRLLLDHIDRESHSDKDRIQRKRALGMAVRMVRGARSAATSREGGNERVYLGLVDGKAYVAVADAHNEISALEMVSYRRDGRKDAR